MAKKRKAPPTLPPAEEQQHEEEEEEEEDEEDTSSSSSSSEEESSSSSEEDDEADESSKREALRKLLEPFNKDQLMDLIKEAAINDPSMYVHITRFADSDPAHRKIFVHGLGRDATSAQLVQAFEPFGEIDECKLITDKATGRAKGYAFVLFKTRVAAKKALKDPQKVIGDRTVSCQLASVGPAGTASASEVSTRKIYVGNVGPNLNADKLRTFFAKFGEIEEGPLGFDSVTNKSKGFAIFVYKSAQGCKRALEEPTKMFDGCQLYCKKFVENISNNNSANSNSSNRNQPGQMGIGDDNYGIGVTPGIMSSNLNMGALLMAQNQGLGFAGNPMMAPVMNHAGMAVPGFSGIGANYGINSMSPNVMGSYTSQAALQGMGAYQSAQMGQSSAGGTAAGTAVGATRAQSSAAPVGTTFPSYFGR